jgi:hypothetical protein
MAITPPHVRATALDLRPLATFVPPRGCYFMRTLICVIVGRSSELTLVEKGASIRHICLEPNSIRDQRAHQSRFI